jgi:peroxiredoxin
MSEQDVENQLEPSVNIETLGECTVLGPAGQQLKINQLWHTQTAVIIFLRHFGCIACRSHALQVWAARDQFLSAGAKLVFIGNGQPTYIEKFREDLGLTGALILTDPSLASFKAAGFRHGFFALVQPKSVVNLVKLAVAGGKNQPATAETGTNWQLGGILVVKPTGKVTYHYISEALGDYPPEYDELEL